jgi:hypothetical protein
MKIEDVRARIPGSGRGEECRCPWQSLLVSVKLLRGVEGGKDTLCWGELLADLLPPLERSWLGLLEECLEPCSLPKWAGFLGGPGLAALTEPKLPPLLLGEELAEFLPLAG